MDHEIKRQNMAMACKGSNFRLFCIPASIIPHLITFSIIFLFIACTKHSRLYLHLISQYAYFIGSSVHLTNEILFHLNENPLKRSPTFGSYVCARQCGCLNGNHQKLFRQKSKQHFRVWQKLIEKFGEQLAAFCGQYRWE